MGCEIAVLTDRRLKDLESPQGVLRETRRGVPAGFNWRQAAATAAVKWLEENPIPHFDALPGGVSIFLSSGF